MLGFKIVDRLDSGMTPILDYALDRGAAIEVGLFFAEQAARKRLEERLRDGAVPVSVHLNHRRLSLLGIRRKEAPLHEQLAVAASLGATSIVTHLGAYPMTARPRLWPRLWEQLAADLDFAQRAAAEHGLRIHVENTFHTLAFYRRLVQALKESFGVQPHFCFDLGHAKVWSCEPLRDWVSFLAAEALEGMTLHLHLHANQGLFDQHSPFAEASRIGIEEDDDFTPGMDWLDTLLLVERRFPEAVKIFEVPADEAIENYEWVVTALADHAPE